MRLLHFFLLQVRDGALWAFDVFLVPGGDHAEMMAAIGFAFSLALLVFPILDRLTSQPYPLFVFSGPSGQYHVRAWVHAGGAYYGVCGGVYLAEGRYVFEFFLSIDTHRVFCSAGNGGRFHARHQQGSRCARGR